ncbi:SH3 domain-containing protein [Falsiroseomonas sp. E2-1-a20]|uniref:SH3 domain-containing protein n=1 Tax=Falsiroseomonas sp. E2-1-a20 TaxID=3239300 RepID=UPI003F2D29EC
MAPHAATKTLVGLTALAAGSAAALVLGWDRRDPRGAAAADPVPATVQRGESGLSLRQEEVAVAAVRAHLRDARVEGHLSSIQLYPLAMVDELVVCGLLPIPGAEAMQVVARVVLNQPTAAARAAAVQDGQAVPQTRPAMVILEAGPGLGRGGSQQGPGLRYCRAPLIASGDSAEVIPATAAKQVDAEAAAAPAARVLVVTPVHVRAAPAGSAAILWTAPRGRSFVVLGQAPGGWIHLGDGQTALGWAHSSLFGPAP